MTKITNTRLDKIRKAQKFLQSLGVDALDVFALQVIQDLNQDCQEEDMTLEDAVEVFIENEFQDKQLIIDVAKKVRTMI